MTNVQARRQFAQAAQRTSRKARQLLESLPQDHSAASGAEIQNVFARVHTLNETAGTLDTLSKVVTPVQVTKPATVPTAPSAPKPVQTAIIGGVLGLSLSLVVTWLVETLDRRLRRPEDARDLVGYPLIGALTKGALGDLPVGSADDETAARMDAFRMLRNNLRFLGGKIRRDRSW